MSRRFASFVFAVCVAVPTLGAPPDEGQRVPRRATPAVPQRQPLGCATGTDLDRNLERLHRFVQARQSGRRIALAAPATRIDKGVYIVGADSAIAPFDHPFDLQDSSLNLTRTSATAFSVQKTALNYDTDIGTLNTTMAGFQTVPYHIASFAFPFYGLSVTDVVISSTKGIFLGTPPASKVYQFSGLEALSQRVPVIAPLLNTTDQPDGYYYLYIKATTAALTITWRSRYTYSANEDIQVVLFSNGDIRFSYRTVTNVFHGAIIVTSGAESWYGANTTIGSFTDTSGDASASIPAAVKDMLDVESVLIRRVSNSDFIEFVITTRADIVPTALASGQYLVFDVEPGGTVAEQSANMLWAKLGPSGTWYQPGGWYYTADSTAVSFAGRTVTLRVLDEQMTFAALPVTVNVYTYLQSGSYTYADSAQGLSIAMTPGSGTGQTNLSSLTAATSIANKPVVEAFTLPSIDLFSIWDALKGTYGLTDTEVDAVVVYQTFPTDLNFYAGGYSTNANPQVDNIAPPSRYQYGTGYAKRASLMHLDKIGYGWNDTANGRMSLISHEFGHRWLYFFTIREGTSDTFNLNPDHAHPKQGVHIPAAFNVVTPTDTSTMGGGYFTQTGTSTYKTAAQMGYYGYSWHELYLMGLASSAEMTQPWFYLRGAGLENAYYPSPDTTYTVTSRVDVTPSQITTSMGLRNPSYATSQKTFRMAFVVLERLSAPVSSTEAATFAADYPSAFRTRFAAITSNRGSIKTAPDSMLPEADFSFSPPTPASGAAVAFTDLSYGEPTSWSWAFGDGASSTSQNPSHAFAAAGTYSVTLSASKTAGSNSITKSVVVSVPPGIPTNVLATASTAGSVTVTWTAAAGCTYEIVRVGTGGASTVLGTATTGSFTDNTPTAGTAYLYKVRMTAPSATAFGTPDLATTVIFTDPTLLAGSTVVKAAHLTELRTAVNAVRSLASQTAAVFSDPTLTPAATGVKSQHLTELRTALDQARAALLLPALTYANSAAVGTPIRAADVSELRLGVK